MRQNPERIATTWHLPMTRGELSCSFAQRLGIVPAFERYKKVLPGIRKDDCPPIRAAVICCEIAADDW
jgi:hypothetical protein